MIHRFCTVDGRRRGVIERGVIPAGFGRVADRLGIREIPLRKLDDWEQR